MDYGSRAEIVAARDAAIAALKESLLNPKPSYDQDGQKVSWTEYRKGLMESLKGLNELLVLIDANESGPGCEETQMI